jgi:hypothetical protein
MPHATAVGGDVNLFMIILVNDDPVSPVKIVAFELFPGFSGIVAAVRGLIEGTGIQPAGMVWVDSHVIDILPLVKNRSPGSAAIVAAENSAGHIEDPVAAIAVDDIAAHHIGQIDTGPARDIDFIGVGWVYGHSIGEQQACCQD